MRMVKKCQEIALFLQFKSAQVSVAQEELRLLYIISQYPGFFLENQWLRGRKCFIISAEVKYTACQKLQEVFYHW